MTTPTTAQTTLFNTISGSLTSSLASGSLTQAQRNALIANAYGAGPGNVFDLNQMHTMVTTPANNYAQALEELKSISGTGNTEIGIATLTEKTTKVQVEQGKLEMINGIIKNAVNYLNNRARSLTQ